MNRWTIALLGIAILLVSVSVGVGEEVWVMRIHKGVTFEEHALADVDSLTFFLYDVVPPVPMSPIPAGTFTMGDGAAGCGVDERQVELTHPFLLGRHEVTNGEYLEALQWAYEQEEMIEASTSFVRDLLDGSGEDLLTISSDYCEIQFDGAGTFYLRESVHAAGTYPDGYDPAEHPVKEVTWFGAARYCDWVSMMSTPRLPRAYEHTGDWACNDGDPYGAMGYRLPTDAEWEYAAQFSDERIYPWGNQSPDCGRANYNYCWGWSNPAGQYPDAPYTLGLSDMAGNSFEWCNDWHVCDLGTIAEIDPVGPLTGTERVFRSGGWSTVHQALRCAYRRSEPPQATYGSSGFRIARTMRGGQ